MRNSLIFLIFAGFKNSENWVYASWALAGTGSGGDGRNNPIVSDHLQINKVGRRLLRLPLSSLLVVFRFGLTWFYLAAIGA